MIFNCVATSEPPHYSSTAVSGAVAEWYGCCLYNVFLILSFSIDLETQTFTALQSENLELKVSMYYVECLCGCVHLNCGHLNGYFEHCVCIWTLTPLRSLASHNCIHLYDVIEIYILAAKWSSYINNVKQLKMGTTIKIFYFKLCERGDGTLLCVIACACVMCV